MKDEEVSQEIKLLDVLAEVEQEDQYTWVPIVHSFEFTVCIRSSWSIDKDSPELLKEELIVDTGDFIRRYNDSQVLDGR